MNIAYFIRPRAHVACLYDDFSLRQALEKMRFHGYTAIPVVTRENCYVGTVSEGDFLWYLVDTSSDGLKKIELSDTEDIRIRDVLRIDKHPPVRITATMEELLEHALHQNFVPVVDDLQHFIGIITRQDILRYFQTQISQSTVNETDWPAPPST